MATLMPSSWLQGRIENGEGVLRWPANCHPAVDAAKNSLPDRGGAVDGDLDGRGANDRDRLVESRRLADALVHAGGRGAREPAPLRRADRHAARGPRRAVSLRHVPAARCEWRGYR